MNKQKTKFKELPQKEKMLKVAKVCEIVTKVFYILACTLTSVFIVLAIVLSTTDAISGYTPAEVALIFGGIALYCFMLIGVLWNVEQIFKNIVIYKTPFNEKVTHYLKKTAWCTILTSVIPALIGSILVKAIVGESEVRFDFQIVGLIVGVVTLLLGYVFNYGITLQKQDDETL